MVLFRKSANPKYIITDFRNEPQDPKYENEFGIITTDYYCPVNTGKKEKLNNRIWWEFKSAIYVKIPSIVIDLENNMKMPIESEEDNW